MASNHEEFREEDGVYTYSSGIGKQHEVITNFVIELYKFSENYMEGETFTNNGSKKFKVLKSELLKKGGMISNFGYFFKGDTVATRFLHWLEQENQDKYSKEIEHFGIIENQYYDENSNVVCGKKDLKFKNLDEIGELAPGDIEILNDKLIKIRSDKNQSLLAISWAIGRYIQLNSYPILEVCGTTSIGKSEFIENISKLLFGVEDNIKNFSTLSNHQIRSLASCSNITPLAIDEVKINSKAVLEKSNMLYSLIRSVYDNKTVNKGNTTSKLDEYKLQTPLIISGETEFSDVSIKNRMISIKLTKENKAEEEIYNYFKESDVLYKLGKRLLELQLFENNVFKKFPFKKIKDDRQKYNANCIMNGLSLLKKIINVSDEDTKNFVIFLENQLSNEYTPEKNFYELLEMVLESDDYSKEYYMFWNNNECLRWEMFYKKLSELHFKTNSALELLDSKTLRKQLLEIGVIEDNSKAITIDNKTKKCVVLKNR